VRILTVKETADLLKVKPQWVYRMMRSDGLPSIRLGRQVRIDEDSLEEWLAEHRSDAHQEHVAGPITSENDNAK